jgi:hypothetical protein
MAATTTAPTAAFTLRTCFVNRESATKKILTIQSCNGLVGFRVIFNLGEAETARLSRKTIAKQSKRIGLNADFRKQCPYLFLCGLKR